MQSNVRIASILVCHSDDNVCRERGAGILVSVALIIQRFRRVLPTRAIWMAGTLKDCTEVHSLVFNTSHSCFRIHMGKAHIDKSHKCGECGKSFTHYHQYKVHLSTHAKKTTFSCKVGRPASSLRVFVRTDIEMCWVKSVPSNAVRISLCL